jgi:hypothetical protein
LEKPVIKQLLIGLLLFFATFVIGGLATLCRMECHGIMHGRMIDGGGLWLFSECTRGVNWSSRSTESYPAAAKANSVFEGRIREAVRVRERNQKKSAEGRTIGERAVPDFRDPQTGKYFTSIFWVDDRHIESIDSTWRYHALLLEWLDQ